MGLDTLTKKCTVCKETLPHSSFHNSKISRDGKGYRCRPCDKDARASYRETNRKRFADVERKKQLAYKYGLSVEQYEGLLNKQNRLCGICGCSETSSKVRGSFAVDHNHDTGENRGLLCNQCYRGLGMFYDDVGMLQQAISYLVYYQLKEFDETH